MAKRTFFIVLLVVLVLTGCYFLPPFSIMGYEFRQVNLVSDVIADTISIPVSKPVKKDTVPTYTYYQDSVPSGMIPIEDFRDSLGIHREMDHFYEALRQSKQRVVRIAYFGDSFIEGDILTAHIRELLQSRFGGCGVGFIDIKSQIAGFRTTVTEFSSGWTEYNAVNQGAHGFNSRLQGINSRYYIPSSMAYIDVKCQNRVFPGHLDTVQIATVYFTPEVGLEMNCSVNQQPQEPFYSYSAITDSIDSIGPRIEAQSVRDSISRIRVTVNGKGRFYGIALEGEQGIVLDNFSMRGSSGWQLGMIPEETLLKFAHIRHYDLIILHYGLNVASPSTHNYTSYCNHFKTAIENFKRAFPDTSLLLFSISNRDKRGPDGQFQTMDGVEELVEAQHNMAKETGIAFWNLQQGMGGSGSMERLQKEGCANKDYTHINFKGGEVIGKIFYDVLMNGKMNYNRRVKQNPHQYKTQKPKQAAKSLHHLDSVHKNKNEHEPHI